ncbi:MAG: DUF917 domain-containing protein [Herpetosiphon sp.]
MQGTGRVLSAAELGDIVVGACLLGSGGGGPLSVAKELLKDLEQLGPVRLVEPSDVRDDERLAVVAIDGSPHDAEQGPFPYTIPTLAWGKLDQLQHQQSGRKLGVVVGAEVGAGNSLIPMIVAAMKGIPVLDGAGAGRAVQKLSLCSFATAGVPVGQIAMADTKRQFALQAPDAEIAELCVRAVVSSRVFPDFAGIALWAMDGATMQHAIVRGVVSRAQQLGKTIREAVDQQGDPAAAACKLMGGRVLFRGRGLRMQQHTSGGFDMGVVTLQSDDGMGTCTIVTQNENLIAWDSRQERPLAMSPDLICYLAGDGQPFSNADTDSIKPEQEVAIIGIPAGAEMRTKTIIDEYLQLLNAAGYFGVYQPLEELQRA